MKSLIPNSLTCSNLICGCIACGAAFHHNFDTAFLFILIGATFDFFDGMVARALGVSGKLGLELDSLADVVTFGVAPSAMVFTLFTEVYYTSWMYNNFWFTVMPFTAFLLAAFSALRLAKFNIDDRQTTEFIGMPTPANAIFWGATISSCEAFLCSARFNALFLLAFVVMFSWLLVSEIRMFSFKFKDFSWANNANKYIFLMFTVGILIICLIHGFNHGDMAHALSLGLSASIGLYIVMSLIHHVTTSNRHH